MGELPRNTASNRNTRDQREDPGPQWSQLDLAELVERLGNDPNAEIRLLYADDAAAEPLWPLLDPRNARMPIALIEPIRSGLVQHRDGMYDARIAIAAKMGLPVAEPARACSADGWTFGPRHGQWELTDPTGTLVARCVAHGRDSVAEPLWTGQVTAIAESLIVYGARIGVRAPEGVPASRYDDQRRVAELHDSLASRQACAAIVKLPQHIRAFRPTRQAGRRT